MRLRHLLIIFVPLAVGCASHGQVDLASLRGLLANAVKANRLDRYRSWPVMNLPAGKDSGTTYLLNEGNLTLWWHGNPPVIRHAEFWPSDTSAEQRYREASAGWDDWVKAHSSRPPPAPSPDSQPATNP
jgi:hypothetical protein